MCYQYAAMFLEHVLLMGPGGKNMAGSSQRHSIVMHSFTFLKLLLTSSSFFQVNKDSHFHALPGTGKQECVLRVRQGPVVFCMAVVALLNMEFSSLEHSAVVEKASNAV